MGRNEHDTKKHGPGTARHGVLRARAWPDTTPCPCLGRIVGPWAGTRHGTEMGLARLRHGLFFSRWIPQRVMIWPSVPFHPPSPPAVYKAASLPHSPPNPKPNSFPPAPAAQPRRRPRSAPPRALLLQFSGSPLLSSSSLVTVSRGAEGRAGARGAPAAHRHPQPRLFVSASGSRSRSGSRVDGAPKKQVC